MDSTRLLELARNDPEQFKRLMEAVKKTVIRPHAGQQIVIDSDARFKILNCGRRWGKTILAAKEAVKRTRKPRQMIWWIAPTYKVTKRGYEEVLKQLPDGVLRKPAPPSSNFDSGRAVILHFKNGTKMEFYSAERPEGMLGAAVDFAVLDEAATMPARIWNQIVSPTLIDHLGSVLMISTPRGRNWFYQVWQKGQDPQQKLWDSWTFTTQDNPTLPEGEADRMAADMTRMEADQEIYAKWLAAGSSVFVLPDGCQQGATVLPNFMLAGVDDKALSVKNETVCLGIDLARTSDYSVLYGARSSDRRNVYFERFNAVSWPEQKRRIRRAVAILMRAGAEHVMLVMDQTGGSVGDPITEDMESEGYDVVGINFTTHKQSMVRLLAKDLEERQAFVIPNGFLEFENYTMAITPGGRLTYAAPEGENDDVVAAKMLQHWGLINEGVAEVAILDGSGEVDSRLERNPWDDVDEETGDYADLIDDDATLEDPANAAEAIGFESGVPGRRPSEQELLLKPDLWL
jgi:hypothetical protein